MKGHKFLQDNIGFIPLNMRTTKPDSLEISRILPKSSVHAAKESFGERTIDSARLRLSGNPYLMQKCNKQANS